MKRVLIAAAALAVVLGGCSKEESAPVEGAAPEAVEPAAPAAEPAAAPAAEPAAEAPSEPAPAQ